MAGVYQYRRACFDMKYGYLWEEAQSPAVVVAAKWFPPVLADEAWFCPEDRGAPGPCVPQPVAAEEEEADLRQQVGDLLGKCDTLLAECAELDATVAEFSDGVRSDVASRRRATRRLRKLRRPSGTGASSAALIAAGETVACVLRRKGGGGGGGGGGVQLLCGWTNEERTWEPLERVHAEHGMDAVRLLRSFDEAKRAESAPRDRGFRPENWEHERRWQARERRAEKFRRRMERLRIVADPDTGRIVERLAPPPAVEVQPAAAPSPQSADGWRDTDWEPAAVWAPVEDGSQGHKGTAHTGNASADPLSHSRHYGDGDRYIYGYGYGYGYGAAPRPPRRVDDISYLQQLPRDQLREALQHVQDFTPEHYELLLQLSEDDVPKTASEEQLSRVDFSYAVQDDCVCMVCLEDVVGTGARMPCDHTFHGPCLREYLGAAKACPLCKAEL
eukprot:TRINITY_DN1172_c0_g1_i4.p1 TRINITY_DN1172_c0_g1~~TRINITY_DN1172_c0_g1_i4.p1  ORF type:complete len:473 (+),score=153.15 TRINITY_DN1172_c0_g1_i4:87-1421(+)